MIIGDSSALIALAIVDKLELLEKLYDQVYVPQAVYDEVTKVQKEQSNKLKKFLKHKVKKVDLKVTKLGLGLGELEAITLCKELNANLLLIDDNHAKKYAVLNDIKVIGSLGILVQAKEKGYISEVKTSLHLLQKSKVHISEKLIIKVLDMCDE